MPGKKSFWNKFLSPDSGQSVTDAERDRWLKDDAWAPQPQWQAPQATPDPVSGPSGGVDIVDVAPGSPLDEAGIREGDVVTAVNGRDTPTERSLAEALGRLGPGETARVTLNRQGSELTLTVTSPD